MRRRGVGIGVTIAAMVAINRPATPKTHAVIRAATGTQWGTARPVAAVQMAAPEEPVEFRPIRLATALAVLISLPDSTSLDKINQANISPARWAVEIIPAT